jgi:hypothetical protein
MVIFSVPGLLGSAQAAGSLASCSSNCAATATLTLWQGPGFNVSPTFWGATITPRSGLVPNETQLLEAARTNVLIWPGAQAGDEYDPLTNQLFDKLDSGYITPTFDEAQFVTLCKAINCTAIIQLPGEIDNPALAAEVVNYTEKNLSFHPEYWEVGNEPGLWARFGCAWSQWTKCRSGAPSNITYAWEVNAYIHQIRTYADSKAVFIGLPGVGVGNNVLPYWVQATVQVNGPNISAVAIHEYPANSKPATGSATLSGFYQTLQGSQAIPIRAQHVREWIKNATATAWGCTEETCNISLFLTEIGSGLSHTNWGSFEQGFSGAIDMAAQMTQALNWSIGNADLYASVLNTNNSWFNSNETAPRPDLTAYTSIFNHLGTVEYPVNISTNVSGLSPWLYAIGTRDPGASNRSDLLVVNTNTQYNVTFTPTLPLGLGGGTTEVWEWVNNRTSAPIPVPFTGEFTLPPNSLALFEAYPTSVPSAPVKFYTTNATAGPRFSYGLPWYVNVGGTLYESNAGSLTVLLPSSSTSYPVYAPSLPVLNYTEGATFQLNASEARFEPFLQADSITVGSLAQSFRIQMVQQWHLTLLPVPSNGGSILPSNTSWGNASQRLNLTEAQKSGFHFSHWLGWGLGSNRTNNSNVTIQPLAPVTEKAFFFQVFAVNFTETGLPRGTPWTVSLPGERQIISGANASHVFMEGNGTYGYKVLNVSGFRTVLPLPAGSVTVNGGAKNVLITFVKRTPPPGNYSVTFSEAGLPGGTIWSVTVLNSTITESTPSIVFSLTGHRSYWYKIGNVTGYVANPKAGSVSVTDTNVTVPVVFTTPPPTPIYPVYFNETGLLGGTVWSVTVLNNTTTRSTPSIVFFLTGHRSYWYTVGNVTGYAAHPKRGLVGVTDVPVAVAITFTAPPPTYLVDFQESGLPSGATWSVIVRGVENASISPSIGFFEPNGTGGFSVGAVVNYTAYPATGSFHVVGAPVDVPIEFVFNQSLPNYFTVNFTESGLPNGSLWKVTVGNITTPAKAPTIPFQEMNGTYGYQILREVGYLASPAHGEFTVAGANLSILVEFLPINSSWAVTWRESGLWAGVSWWVIVDGTTLNNSGAWRSIPEHNGSYSYTVGDNLDFVPSPRVGVVQVQGSEVIVPITFIRAAFPVVFSAQGLPSGLPWEVRLSTIPIQANASQLTVVRNLPNGTYTYDVSAPPGYFSNPSHGNLTIKAATQVINLSFQPSRPGPIPPIWSLGSRAAAVAILLGLAGWVGFAALGRVHRSRITDY